jgi:hypothetical protein
MFDLGSGLIGQGASGLQTALGLEQLPLDFGEFAANLAASQANTEIAASGGQGNVTANFGPSGNDLLGTALSSFGSNLFNSSGGFDQIGEAIGSIFERPEKPTPSGK